MKPRFLGIGLLACALSTIASTPPGAEAVGPECPYPSCPPPQSGSVYCLDDPDTYFPCEWEWGDDPEDCKCFSLQCNTTWVLYVATHAELVDITTGAPSPPCNCGLCYYPYQHACAARWKCLNTQGGTACDGFLPDPCHPQFVSYTFIGAWRENGIECCNPVE